MNTIKKLFADRRSMIGMILLSALTVAAFLGPVAHGIDPLEQRDILQTRFLSPLTVDAQGVMHWLGTDALGRDLLARLIHGARISLLVGLLSVGVSVLVGTAIGVSAAVWGGVTDRALMAVTDAALAMPRIILLLALVTLWEPSAALVVLVLGFTGWMSLARLTRAEVQSLLARPYVAAAASAGVTRSRLLLRHLLPNALTPIIVVAALGVGNAIMLEAGLSFLGLGVPAPAPSWGNIIASGRDALVNAPWVATLPGLAVVMTVIACNLLGDGVRDALDPRAEVL